MLKFPKEVTIEFDTQLSDESMEFFTSLIDPQPEYELCSTGRFWFDTSWKFAGYLKEIQIKNGDEYICTYAGENLVDTSNNSFSARFLRWFLRR